MSNHIIGHFFCPNVKVLIRMQKAVTFVIQNLDNEKNLRCYFAIH